MAKAHLRTGPLTPDALREPLITTLGVPHRRPDWSSVFADLAAALEPPAPPP